MWYTKYKTLGDLRLSPQAFPALAEALLGYLVGIAGTTKKVLTLDLDETIWRGTLSEDGIAGISQDINVQKRALILREKGALLTIISKNDERDALNAIEIHPKMILRKNHFTAWRINWDAKVKNLRELAHELNVGLESFAFVDDNPAERAAIEAEVGVREMMEYLRQKKIPGQYDLSELEEDMARLYKKVALSRSP